MSDNYKINTISTLTWNWLKTNYDSVNFQGDFKNNKVIVKNHPKGFLITDTYDSINELENFKQGSGIFNQANEKEQTNYYDCKDYTIHPLYSEYSKLLQTPQYIIAQGQILEPLIINLSKKDSWIACQKIIAKANSNSTIILILDGPQNNSLIQTQVFLEDNANLTLTKIQLNHQNTNQLDDTSFYCKDNAHATFNLIELGGKHIDSGLYTTLFGNYSSFIANTAYFTKESQYLDFNHNVIHYGKKTQSNMQVAGSLKDFSTKVYRGIIDFKNGCSGSKGEELEETLLLNKEVTNKSLPTILCDEEDVEGEHGSTIGKISKDTLFYMQSHCIDEITAQKLLSKAKIQTVADTIPDKQIQNTIYEYMEKSI